MIQGGYRKIFAVAGAFFLVWGAIKYFLPLIAPFLLGWFLAFLAEPMTRFLHEKLRFRRALAAAVSVSLVLAMSAGVIWLLFALGYRELAGLASGLPEYAQALGQRLTQVRDWTLGLVSRAPGDLADGLTTVVSGLFTEGSMILEKLTSWALSAAGSVAGKIPGGALMLGTAVVSAYMIAAEYPMLKRRLTGSKLVSGKWVEIVQRLWRTIGLWLRAQLKLMVVIFAIVAAGFLILRVKNWLPLAVMTAIVDAVPMLGTGTVLVPMAIGAVLWGNQIQGLGLLGLYLTAMLTRSALEPRMVGKQLGMNPLTTLMALYVGFRIWGVPGMIFSPILAVTVTQLASSAEG